jgi:hypothetical protein
MTVTVLSDLLAFAGVFLIAWLIYLVVHLLAARLDIVRGATRSTVALGVGAALVAAVVSWRWCGAWFSSPAVHDLATITAPAAFLGYCGIYVLLGPVTIDRSISLSMLRALHASQDRKLRRHELHREVPFDRIFEKRLRELELSGSIDTSHEVVITARGARILGAYVRLARLFNVDFQ